MKLFDWFTGSKPPKKPHSHLSFIVLPDKSVDLEIYLSNKDNAKEIAQFLDAVNTGKFVPIIAEIIGKSKSEGMQTILYEWSLLIHSRKSKKNFIPPSKVLDDQSRDN